MISIEELKNKLISNKEKNEFYKKVGYQNKGSFEKMVNYFLNVSSYEEWLKSSHYDFTHFSESFLIAILKALNLYDKNIQEYIKKLKEKQKILYKLKTPFIFIDTSNKRPNGPIFAIAIIERERRIYFLKEEIFDLGLETTLKNISNFVKNHYKNKNGKLIGWGKIISYIYHHIDGSVYKFDKNGNFEKIDENISTESAVISIK